MVNPEEARKRALSMRKTMIIARDSYLEHYDDLRRFLLPRHGKNLVEDDIAIDTFTKGQKKHEDIFDGSHLRNVKNAAAGIHSGMTNPSQRWFRLKLGDHDLSDKQEVAEWLFDVENRMYDVIKNSNVYNVLHQCYAELVVFGTAAVTIDTDYDTVIRGRALTVGEYYIASDSTGRISAILMTRAFTAQNMIEKFGEDRCSQQVKEAFKMGKAELEFPVWHLVEKRNKYNDMKEAQGRKFVSMWFEMSKNGNDTSQGAPFLRVSGFDSLPFLTPRWLVIGDNVYGDSAGMDVLADVKSSQKLAKSVLVATDKSINPPVQADASLRKKKINTLPGGVNWVDNLRDNSGIRNLYESKFDFNAAEALQQRLQNSVAEGMFADLFRMLQYADKNGMTATEVAERQQEKLLLLGPVIERVQSELLDPLIDRVFAIMMELDILPEPPQEIQGEPLQVHYSSILSQAQKLVGTTAIEQGVAFIGNLSGVKPGALDLLNEDEIIRDYFDRLGVTPKALRSNEQVATSREAQAKQAQQQQMMEQMSMAADGAKTLSETNVGDNNALEALTGTML